MEHGFQENDEQIVFKLADRVCGGRESECIRFYNDRLVHCDGEGKVTYLTRKESFAKFVKMTEKCFIDLKLNEYHNSYAWLRWLKLLADEIR